VTDETAHVTDRSGVPALAGQEPARPPAAPDEAVPVVGIPGSLDRNPAAVYLAGKPSDVGRRGLQRSLDRAAEILTGGVAASALTVHWAEVRYQHVAALRAALIDQDAKPATINHVLSAVRGTLREAWKLELIDAESLARITNVPNVKVSTLPAGRHVDVGEVTALFRACPDTPVGARDAAMLALLYGCGLRRSEAVAVQLADYDSGKVTVLRGKGRKERFVYCPAGGREAVDAWIARRGSWPGALLCPVVKGGHVKQRTMTAQAVMMRLRFLAQLARVPTFSPHDLRRSFVGELLDAGADISSVQQLVGHSSVTTTQRYDRRPEDAKRRTAEMLHVPYSRPALLVGGGPHDVPAEDSVATDPLPADPDREG
jgi:site-specific recombinase XerD